MRYFILGVAHHGDHRRIAAQLFRDPQRDDDVGAGGHARKESFFPGKSQRHRQRVFGGHPFDLIGDARLPERHDEAGADPVDLARRGALMTSACICTFVMAESGLLDRHHATTTWWLAPLFRKRYPGVLLDESHMIVKSGRLVTAGAALSHMDLALWLVRGVSPQLASLTAKYLIVDTRPSQSAYALTDHLVHSDPIKQRFEAWARGRLTHGFSLDAAAKAVGASKRTLARRMESVLAKSPLSYFQSLRVERAVHLLKTGRASVEEVAARVGYADGTPLRSLLRRRLNLGVKEIRKTP